MKIEEIEKELDKLPKLRFNKNKPLPKNKKEVLNRILQGEATFMNSDRYVQCAKYRMRGINNIYRTIKNYFPDTTLKYVLDECYSRSPTFCDQTNQHVYTNQTYGSKISKPYIKLAGRKKVLPD